MNNKKAENNSNRQRREVELPKQSRLYYRCASLVVRAFSRLIFKRQFIRNEIKNKKGPFVVIANHQAAYDFVNLMSATRAPMHFVISESFYNSLPIKGFLSKLGVIPKQQFQTSLHDLRLMKKVIEEGKILVIYPAGLMCEDGLSTPIPESSYQFLKWIKADVYMAKTVGTYFAMPKWTGGMRPGKTYIDIYKLFDKEELESMELSEVKDRAEEAMLFDAYREQEKLLVRYKNGSNIEGLENVLYICPNCGKKHTVRVRDKSEIYCESCGFSERCDEYGFLHKTSECGEEIRYVSDWSIAIQNRVREELGDAESFEMVCPSKIFMLDGKKFSEAGYATVRLTKDRFYIDGEIKGEKTSIEIPTASFASLPFSPAKYMEIQHGDVIYRCAPDDKTQVTPFVHAVKVIYEIHCAEHERV